MSSELLTKETHLNMRDIEGMTVAMHHELCLGLLNRCYDHVPEVLKIAISVGVRAAREMGAPVDEFRLGTGQGLFTGGIS